MASSSHLPYKTKKIPQFLLHLTKLPLGRQFEKKYDVYLAKIPHWLIMSVVKFERNAHNCMRYNNRDTVKEM